MPKATYANVRCEASGSTVRATGDATMTVELQVDAGGTFKANGNTITSARCDINSTGILDMETAASTLAFTGTAGFISNNDGVIKLGHADLGKAGIGALNFTGLTSDGSVRNKIQVSAGATIDNLTTFTYSFWVKQPTLARENLIYKGTNVQLEITASNTIEAFRRYTTTNDRATTSTTISANTWTHIAWTATSASAAPKIYINGAEASYSTQTAGVGDTGNGTAKDDDGSALEFGRALNGIMADIRLYSNALDATDISNLYNSGNPQPEIVHDSITHWWKGDDATGSTISDVVGSVNGAITGATWTNASIIASDGSTDYNFSLSAENGETVLTCNHAMIDGNAEQIRMDNNQTHTFNDVYFNGSNIRPFSGGTSYQDITFNRCRFGEQTGGSNILRSEGGAIDIVMNNCRLNQGSDSSAFRIGNSHLTLNDCIFEGNNFGSGSAPAFNGTNTILISDQAQIVIVDPKTSYTDVLRERTIFISPSNGSTGSTHFGIYSALQGVAGFTKDKNIRIEDIYGSRSPFFKISTNNLQCKSLYIGADTTVEITDDVDFYTGALELHGTLVGSVIDDGSSPFEIPNKLDALHIVDNKIDGELITGVNNLI